MKGRISRFAVWAGLFLAGLAVTVGVTMGLPLLLTQLTGAEALPTTRYYFNTVFPDLLATWVALYLLCLSFRSRLCCGICMCIAGISLVATLIAQLPQHLILTDFALLNTAWSLLSASVPYLAVLVGGVLFLCHKHRALSYWSGAILLLAGVPLPAVVGIVLVVVTVFLVIHLKSAWFYSAEPVKGGV